MVGFFYCHVNFPGCFQGGAWMFGWKMVEVDGRWIELMVSLGYGNPEILSHVEGLGVDAYPISSMGLIYLPTHEWLIFMVNGLVNIPYTWILLAYGWLEPRDILFLEQWTAPSSVCFFSRNLRVAWIGYRVGSWMHASSQQMPPGNQVGMQASLSLWVLDDLVCSCQTCQCHTLPCM